MSGDLDDLDTTDLFEDDDHEVEAEVEDEAPEGDGEPDEGRREALPEKDEGEEEPVRRPDRRAARVQALTHAAKEAKERAERAERRLAELENQSRTAKPAAEDPEAEARKLALMTTEERMEYRLEKMERQAAAERQQMRFQLQDQADASEFKAYAATNPVARKFTEKVETKLTELRGQGLNVGRKQLLAYLIGEAILEKGPKAVSAQRKASADAVARATTRPSNGAGDIPANRSRVVKSLAQRLENVQI